MSLIIFLLKICIQIYISRSVQNLKQHYFIEMFLLRSTETQRENILTTDFNKLIYL